MTISLLANMFSALLLFACMFLQIATYQGDATGIAVTIMALTWVNGLDEAAMKANPTYEKVYQAQIALQTEPAKIQPMWIKDLSHLMKPIFGIALYGGIVMAVCTYWITTSSIVTAAPGPHVGL